MPLVGQAFKVDAVAAKVDQQTHLHAGGNRFIDQLRCVSRAIFWGHLELRELIRIAIKYWFNLCHPCHPWLLCFPLHFPWPLFVCGRFSAFGLGLVPFGLADIFCFVQENKDPLFIAHQDIR
jgi:hypothetical protein